MRDAVCQAFAAYPKEETMISCLYQESELAECDGKSYF